MPDKEETGMKLYTIVTGQAEEVAAEGAGGKLYTLKQLGFTVKDMNELIDRWEEVRESLASKLQSAAQQDACTDYQIIAPIPSPRQDVICLGVNYRDHMEETVKAIDFTKKAATVYFSKRVSRANAPGGVIPTYDFVDSLDYEVELGVILKKDAFGVRVEDAGDYIFGYTVINDVSARNVQKMHQQWYRGKSLDGYTPMGPCIVTADEIGDAHDLRITCAVNGELRQDGNTAYMITSVEEAISELSCGMTLKAASIIATGTPGGVAMGMETPVYLKKGDVVRCEIANIGVLENTIG